MSLTPILGNTRNTGRTPVAGERSVRPLPEGISVRDMVARGAQNGADPGKQISAPAAIDALAAARAAGERMRKRARAGSLVVNLPAGATNSRVYPSRRSLVGG